MNRFLVLLLSGLLPGASAAAEDSDSMKGLPGAWVVIAELGEIEGVGGLFKQFIQTDVELALRTAGIKVLTEQEFLAHPAAPYLYLSVHTVFSADGSVSCSTDPSSWIRA